MVKTISSDGPWKTSKEQELEVAEEGECLTKQLCSKATSHRRALEREKTKPIEKWDII